MPKRLVSFRVEDRDWRSFRELAEKSGYSIQSIFGEFISACVRKGSLTVQPELTTLSGEELAGRLALRESLQRLRGYMEAGNFEDATRLFHYNLIGEVKQVRDSALLEEAQSLTSDYLKWIDKHHRKAGSYNSGGKQAT